MQLFLSYLILAAGVVFSAIFFNLALRMARADKIESKKSAARVNSLLDSILGRAHVHDDWAPDARVKGGLIFNRGKKRIEMSGRLSDDSIDRVFR